VGGLRRQATRSLPSGVSRYGYLLENQEAPVGCLLMVYSTRIVDGEAALFCNLSSWYVGPGIPQLCGAVRLDDPEAQGRHLFQRHAGDRDLAGHRGARFPARLCRQAGAA
jgi:hypothetical protein